MAHGYLGDGYGVHGEFDREFDPDRGDEHSGERRGSGRRGPVSQGERIFEGGDRGPDDEDRWSDRTWRGGYGRGQRDYSSNPDDHYRSWRDRHMSQLDRDYADYCREREDQFQSDFEKWRHERHGSAEPLRTGMTQTGLSADPTGLAQAEAETSAASPETSDPMGSATLGTTPRRRGRS